MTKLESSSVSISCLTNFQKAKGEFMGAAYVHRKSVVIRPIESYTINTTGMPKTKLGNIVQFSWIQPTICILKLKNKPGFNGIPQKTYKPNFNFNSLLSIFFYRQQLAIYCRSMASVHSG